METVRALFRASQQGDEAAEATLKAVAIIGDKEAEFVMLEEIAKVRTQVKMSFAEALIRVAEANPVLHLAYLNGNGTKNW